MDRSLHIRQIRRVIKSIRHRERATGPSEDDFCIRHSAHRAAWDMTRHTSQSLPMHSVVGSRSATQPLYSALLVQAPTIVTSLVQTIAGPNENNLFLTNLFKHSAAHPRMNSGLSTGLARTGRLKRGLEFRDVSFSYPGVTDNVLEGVNLIVRPGERIRHRGQ